MQIGLWPIKFDKRTEIKHVIQYNISGNIANNFSLNFVTCEQGFKQVVAHKFPFLVTVVLHRRNALQRMHSSRMHTIRHTGRLDGREGCLPGVGGLPREGVSA